MKTLAFRLAALLGGSGVALGAFGAHGLKELLAANGAVAIWNTASQYQLVHAVALLALAAAGRADRTITVLWFVGVLIFSGTLYLLGITGIRWLGAITPIGGTALIIGWFVLLMRGR